MPKSKHSENHQSNITKAFSPSGFKNGGNLVETQTKFDVHNHNYNFTFNTDLTSVTSQSKVNGTNSKSIDITASTFKTTVGLNEKNVQAVVSVEKKSVDTFSSSTQIFSDADGDGQYIENFDIQVAKTLDSRLTQQKFTVNTDGTITVGAVVGNNHHNHSSIEQNAVLNKVTLNNVTYITKTQANVDASGYRFEVFRDDNSDGTWTEIAHGDTSGSNIDTATTTLNLVGIQSYLIDTSTLVG